VSTPLDVLGCELSGTTLIEASAGTGKTWNICALYLRLLLERSLPVQSILVVTFTKAATAELRDRIRARIVEVLAAFHGGASAAIRSCRICSRRCAPGPPGRTDRATTALARANFRRGRDLRSTASASALADAPFVAQLPLEPNYWTTTPTSGARW
jgi:exodeoxyribonuclease V beta subunit